MIVESPDSFHIAQLLLKGILEKAYLYEFREGEFFYRKGISKILFVDVFLFHFTQNTLGEEANYLYIIMKGEIGIYG